jgi:ATP adenylyltransferase
VERLWSPWRLEYVTGTKPEGCVFCLPSEGSAAEGRAGAAIDQRALVVFEGRTAYVILNLYPYNNGHLLVVPNRHVPSLAALTPEELQEIAVLSQRCEVALTEAYTPQGINVGVNLGKPAGAGVENHLHVHLVPRWNGDTNFMTVVGEMRVLPEDLKSSAARLRPIFARLAS